MSIADVTQQISDIQSRLALLAQTVASGDGGAGFASALSGATATTATSSATTATSTSGVTGDDVVKAAMQYEGTPYVLGGESKSGIDCSGLVQASFKSLGVEVPRTVHEQKTIGTEVPSLKDAKPGDLIVLNGGDHVAIWMGDGKAIHAPYPGRTVSVQKAWFDDADITTIRRVVPATATATADVGSGTVSAVGASTAGTSATSSSGLTSSALSQAVALMGMYGGSTDSSGTDSLSSLLSSYGASGTSSSTAQQLLAARAAMAGS